MGRIVPDFSTLASIARQLFPVWALRVELYFFQRASVRPAESALFSESGLRPVETAEPDSAL